MFYFILYVVVGIIKLIVELSRSSLLRTGFLLPPTIGGVLATVLLWPWLVIVNKKF
jgi:hypothetical protein